jgi:predicted cupin superfamily sugar epimerase
MGLLQAKGKTERHYISRRFHVHYQERRRWGIPKSMAFDVLRRHHAYTLLACMNFPGFGIIRVERRVIRQPG